jgi:hypothetical protein
MSHSNAIRQSSPIAFTKWHVNATAWLYLCNQLVWHKIIKRLFNALWQHDSGNYAVPYVVLFPNWAIRKKFALR